MNIRRGSFSDVGFFSLLAIVFITLKLTDVIDWSWWYVLLPIWWGVPLIILAGIFWIFWRLFYDG